MLSLSDVMRLLAVFTASGVFWMMILFLVEKVSLNHPLPGSTGLAIVVLVASAYFVIAVVTKDSLALMMP